MIFNVTGGGGAALNFKVLAYATEEALQAATPAENTIGIITETPIICWLFSATEPSPAAAGMVWITVSISSAVEFNALKKNGIQVYPMSAKQYVDGSWVDVTAMSYQGGEWADWVTYLYIHGDVCDDITGGWKTVAIDDSDTVSHHPTVTYNDDYVQIGRNWSLNDGGVFCTTNKIDLTSFDRLCFEGSLTIGAEYGICNLYVWSSLGSTAATNVVASKSAPVTDYAEIDISSLSGEYVIGFYLHGAAVSGVTMYSMYLQ